MLNKYESVHADDVSIYVYKRTAAVSVVYRGICLYVNHLIVGVGLPGD